MGKQKPLPRRKLGLLVEYGMSRKHKAVLPCFTKEVALALQEHYPSTFVWITKYDGNQRKIEIGDLKIIGST